MSNEDSAEQLVEHIIRLVPKWRRASIRNVEYLAGGYSNRNYRFDVAGDAFVIRVVDSRPHARDAEQRYLNASSAPDVVAFDSTSGNMITRWIDGALLAHEPASPNEGAAYLQTLHARTPVGISTYDPRAAIATFDATTKWLELLNTIGWAPKSICGCHNDLNPWNIIRDGNDWRTLDWEVGGDNDPMFDVVGFAYGAEYSEVDFDRCVAAYFDDGFEPAHLRATCVVFQLREHTWALDQISKGNDRAEILLQAVRTDQELARLTAASPSS
ncbi:MAG: phosphotransferase [Gammaproteobacteria bacterium]|nr:phosphotransferase [Gammaproteobacteria bacterium]